MLILLNKKGKVLFNLKLLNYKIELLDLPWVEVDKENIMSKAQFSHLQAIIPPEI